MTFSLSMNDLWQTSVLRLMALALACSTLFTTPGRADDAPQAFKDAQPTLQALLDRGGKVEIPAGMHHLAKTLAVDLDKVGPISIHGYGVARLVMHGSGPALRLVGTHRGTAAPDSVKPNVWERQRMPLLDGLEILGAHDEASGIEADGTMQLTITRVTVRDALHGIRLFGRNRNVIIAECHIYQNRGVGLLLDDVNLHQINVSHCHISYNDQGGIVSRKGNVRNLHVGTCDIEANMGGPDSEPSANLLLDSTGGEAGIAEVAVTGCTLQHTHKGPNSANIRILGRSAEGHNEGNVTISGNVFSDAQINVDIKHARGVALTGNTFWSGYTANLVVEDSSNVAVTSNLFDRNPRYEDVQTPKNVVIFRRCRDSTLIGLHITDARGEAGLTLDSCERLNVAHCTILDCPKAGMLVKDLVKCRISNCLIDHRESPADWKAMIIEGGRENKISQ